MTAFTFEQPRTLASAVKRSMPRAEYYAALYILGCANGIGIRVHKSVTEVGWVEAFFATFQVSGIIWMACVAGISLMLVDNYDRIRQSDLFVGLGFLFFVAIPISPIVWTATTLLSLYILVFTKPPSARRRGALILLATAVPMFWSPYLFSLFANFILEIDAWLVASILHSTRIGNMVGFADHSGYLVIYPACSSLANISLAFLCWMTMNQYFDHRFSLRDTVWCFLACAAVVLINVTRMSIMGLSPYYHSMLHGVAGETVSNLIILVVTVGFCLLGVKREFFARV